MEYLALYRKYRPKELDEVVGQSEIKKILASSVKNGTITHAYLFSGPRGTGKTTMAKILAKMVNCLDPVNGNACNKCNNCINLLNSNDVIEIDAASNNGVDEIRDLREKANLVPSFAKYKVYIIDEVHMLTTQAFNALLKTLEEPPKHVIFILATTEYYKIPLTITSRCQKFQFTKISVDEIVQRLKEIANLEKIKIDDEALVEIAKISDGGMRDSINFLDQLRSFTSKKITVDDVYEVCGDISNADIYFLFKAIYDNDPEKITDFFENMSLKGKNFTKFLENVTEFLKDTLLYSHNVNYKFIKNDLNILKEMNALFDIDQVYYFIESINSLMDKFKNISRQSTIVLTNFLMMMNRINAEKLENIVKNDEKNNEAVKLDIEEKYDMAFNFTPDVDVNTTDKTNIVDVNSKDDMTSKDFVDDENRTIIINNAFAVASKEIKSNLQNMMSKFSDYLTDKKFKVAAGALIDTNLEVAGDDYLIFSATNDAFVQKVYDNYELVSELINEVFSKKYFFVVLNYDEWNSCRDEYVKNFRSGKKYELIELKKNVSNKKVTKKSNSVVDKLFELVGEDNVEFK